MLPAAVQDLLLPKKQFLVPIRILILGLFSVPSGYFNFLICAFFNESVKEYLGHYNTDNY